MVKWVLLVALVAAAAGVAAAARGGGRGKGGGRGRHSMGSRMPIMIHRSPASANYYNNKDVSNHSLTPFSLSLTPRDGFCF
jgi:hypothetical protein